MVDDAVAIAAALGAHITAVACETRVQLPGHFISSSLVSGMISSETDKSRKNARELLAAFDAAAERAGILHEAILEKCITLDVPDILVEYARLRDLTILSVPASYDQWYAEAIIFGSGKPTLILPESPQPRPFELGTVAVAWDFSRAAARAISDALPILERAEKVRVVTVTTRRRWIASTPPNSWPRIWPGTASTSCWIKLTSQRSWHRRGASSPMRCPIRRVCW